MLITGNFNTPGIDWQTLSAHGHYKATCDHLIEIAISFDLTQIINSATHENAILDFAFVNEQLRQYGYHCDIVEGLSDHKGVTVDFNLATVPKPPLNHTVLNFEHADDNPIIEMFASSFDEFSTSASHYSVDVLLTHFYAIVNQCIADYIPTRCIKCNPKHPWYTREIIHLIRRMRRLRKQPNAANPMKSSVLTTLKSSLKSVMSSVKSFYFNNTLSSFIKVLESRHSTKSELSFLIYCF